MKKQLFCCLISSCIYAQQPTIFIHDRIVQADQSTFIDLASAGTQQINVTYIPQQVITVRKEAKKLPIAVLPPAGKKYYFKYIMPEKPVVREQEKSVELLISSETLGNGMQKLLAQKNKRPLTAQQHVVRFYRRIESDDNSFLHWKPILTMPLARSRKKIKAQIMVCPDGSITLGNA